MSASNEAAFLPEPNWSQFYTALLRLGPSALIGIPPDWIEWFREEGSRSEWFWYEGIDDEFIEEWNESPELAVKGAFQRYVMGVQAGLRDLPVPPNSEGWLTCSKTGALLTWDESILAITGELAAWHVQALLGAARARN